MGRGSHVLSTDRQHIVILLPHVRRRWTYDDIRFDAVNHHFERREHQKCVHRTPIE
jgi:hypothetical protein